jgi:putative molybdopterin biosynthesis protein
MTTRRNIYLDKKTLAEARDLLFRRFPMYGRLAPETAATPDAVGRVLAEPVFARLSSPNFHAAAMDGIAVRAAETFGASEGAPKSLALGSRAFPVNTGHVLPEGTDAVIMIENVVAIDEKTVQIEAPAYPWQHVRKMGEDIVATELLFPRDHEVTPYCIGALLSGGIFSVTVHRRPRVLIIPTGSELVDWQGIGTDDLAAGQVIESNSFVLGTLCEGCGAGWERHDRIMDDAEQIGTAVKSAAGGDFDIVLVVGGSSAGSEDYAREVISSLGEVLVHGVTIMPGKPVIMGAVSDTPVFGMPGYPVSAIVAFEQFVQPLIRAALGQPDRVRQHISATPTRKIASKLGVEEFLRVKLGRVGERTVATPLPRGAGVITSLTEADGIIRIANHLEGLPENEPTAVELLRPLTTIEKTLVVVGSHDNTLDLLADELRAGHTGLTLSSSHVGSMGGLMALKKGGCHLAGSHLLDTADGSYNLSYIKRFLPDMAVRVVNLVFRDQGLMVAPGNPKGIRAIEDLAREDVRFINRQGGSGTRILLDYRLGDLNIDPAAIQGYENEEFTHMSVAVAVLSGAADAGLGIHAAARALNLDFIPVVTEQYDLIIPEPFFETDMIRKLLETIRTDRFKSRVRELGGYSTEKTGEVIL